MVDKIEDINEDSIQTEPEEQVQFDACEDVEQKQYTPPIYNMNERHEGYATSMGDKPIGFFERMMELIFKHGLFKSIGAFLLIMACVMIWQFINALNYNKVAERIVSELVEKQIKDESDAKDMHAFGSSLRLQNNGKIQRVLTHLLYDVGADRVSILEMHNGKENPSALPFVYCDMTYEETKDKVPFIADEYEQLNMGKYPIFTHLINERVFLYTADEVKEYDRKFYSKLELNDTKYIAMLVIKNELDVGFLVVSFLSEPKIDVHQLFVKLNDCAQQLGVLLDFTPENKKEVTK